MTIKIRSTITKMACSTADIIYCLLTVFSAFIRFYLLHQVLSVNICLYLFYDRTSICFYMFHLFLSVLTVSICLYMFFSAICMFCVLHCPSPVVLCSHFCCVNEEQGLMLCFHFMLCSPFMLACDLFSTYCSAIGDAVLAHFPRHQTNSRHFHPTASG